MPDKSHYRRFHGDPAQLRSPERIALLEVDRVVSFSIEKMTFARVLDVGTGTGLFAERYSATGSPVVGIDVNAALLREAKHSIPSAEFIRARAEAIPFKNSAFDLLFLGLVLHEVDDPLQTLKEARRVSSARVVVLEWPYARDTFGPPLEHRLGKEKILSMAEQAQLECIQRVRLAHTELYRMEVLSSKT